ncbi:MAG TPA: leucyl/phenylalanyl-tRNA--protein transferase [Verrucomicrobiae bacterium]|nr:leucyl/phenylalanyl-tRNA--protein transferase [Verrucomicrobiae bacterium]
MPVKLDQRVWFPDPATACGPDGLVAVGGDFSPERLVAAYGAGIFPWSVKPITWWSPDPRGVIELDDFHISQSLAKFLRKEVYEVTMDRAFREVMEACAAPDPKRGGTWITKEFIAAYVRLHELGHAHSVECWRDGKLVGGIYGVSVGGLFAGESMFHRADNASKVVLCKLVEHLRARGFGLFDIQMVTAATKPFGAREIAREEYLRRLVGVVGGNARFL